MRSISESGILAIFLGGLVLNQTTSRATVLHEAPGRLARCFVLAVDGTLPGMTSAAVLLSKPVKTDLRKLQQRELNSQYLALSSYLWLDIPVMTVHAEIRAYHLGMSAGRPATKPTPAFGKKLAQLRKRRGWTQPELAEQMGVAVKTITYYEREATNPTAKTVERLAEVFGIMLISTL